VTRAINLVVSCTRRKRYGVTPGMAVHELKGCNLEARLRLWKQRLREVRAEEHPAGDTYLGDQWHVVRSIPNEAERFGLKVRLWIASAGYGLIRPDTPIKAYEATFTPGGRDYIGFGISANGNVVQEWWAGVCEYHIERKVNFPRSLLALAEASPQTPMVVALSADYLRAVGEDLAETLRYQFFQEHLAIVSCGTGKRHAVWENNLLPCDGSMMGALGGTLTSLNVRVVRRLLQLLQGAEPTVKRLALLADSRRTIIEAVWGLEQEVEENTLDAFIRLLRSKVDRDFSQKLLHTVRGTGYTLGEDSES